MSFSGTNLAWKIGKVFASISPFPTLSPFKLSLARALSFIVFASCFALLTVNRIQNCAFVVIRKRERNKQQLRHLDYFAKVSHFISLSLSLPPFHFHSLALKFVLENCFERRNSKLDWLAAPRAASLLRRALLVTTIEGTWMSSHAVISACVISSNLFDEQPPKNAR